MKHLITFENPDKEFNIQLNYSGDYTLEIGDSILYESDDMTDEEIIEWAEEYSYLDDDDNSYIDEDGNPYIDSLRALKRSQEEEFPPPHATPSGRAFIYFQGINIPESIKVELIDGCHPGNDWQGVVVGGSEQLVLLQEYFFEKGLKVNFKMV